MAVKYDKVSLDHRALEDHLLAWVLVRHALEVLYEGDLAICDMGIVLRVACSDVAIDCLFRLALIEHEVVERHGILTILLRTGGHGETFNGCGALSSF
jgi:hypothetical protein